MRRTVLLLLMVLMLTSCSDSGFWDLFKPTGHTKMVTRMLPDFSMVQVNENMELQVLVQDTVSKVLLSAGDNLLSKITTRVENGTLVVKNNNAFNFMRSSSRVIRLVIYTKSLEKLSTNTSRNFVVDVPQRVLDTLQLSLRGCGGDGMLFLNARKLRIQLSESSSRIVGNGAVDSLYYSSGFSFGPIDLSNVAVRYAHILQDGSNDVTLRVSDSLNVVIKGIGNVYYIGTPKIKAAVTGKGRLLQK